MIFRSTLPVMLLLCCSFYSNELKDAVQALQIKLNQSVYLLPSINAAKTKLEVTPTGFVRFTETQKSGKQHYASLNLNQFLKMDYYGTTQSGILVLRSMKKNVIVQTFNDPAGEVDSMSNRLEIPLTMMEPKQLINIQNQLLRIKTLLLQIK
jgi:hypothetical protein